MAVDKKIFILSGIITLLLFACIILVNVFLNDAREQAVSERIDSFVEGYDELRAISFLSDVFGENATCLSLQSSLSFMNQEVWDIGKKIEGYNKVNDKFAENPYYVTLKKRFNREEIMYFSLLKRMTENCNLNKTIILYFYKKSQVCPMCDSQAFVLTDLRYAAGEDVAVFSFDSDLELPSVNMLISHYNVTGYPCIVVDGETFCGSVYDKDKLANLLCSKNSNLSIC